MRIISGGQTGADRAAMDFALCNNIAVSGWCPMGCTAENGTIPLRYPLSSSFSPLPLVRTEYNVLYGDATLILIFEAMDKGTRQTLDLARQYGKPVFVWKIGVNNNYEQFHKWLDKNRVNVLNIAGPRESFQPGIYSESLNMLDRLFSHLIIG